MLEHSTIQIEFIDQFALWKNQYLSKEAIKNSVQANYVEFYRRTRQDEDYKDVKEANNAATTEIRQSKRIYEQNFDCNIKNGCKRLICIYQE